MQDIVIDEFQIDTVNNNLSCFALSQVRSGFKGAVCNFLFFAAKVNCNSKDKTDKLFPLRNNQLHPSIYTAIKFTLEKMQTLAKQ